MKKRIAVVLLLTVAMILPLFAMTSCNDDNPSEQGTNAALKYDSDGKLIITTLKGEEHIKVKHISADELKTYSVLCADLASTAVSSSMMGLYNDIKDNIVEMPNATTDWVDRGKEIPTDTKEFLIGFTNRAESPTDAELRRKDYVIGYKNGRVVICGGSDSATQNAVDYFRNNFVDRAKKEIVVPDGNDVKFEYDYVFESININGVPLADYKIKSSGYREGVAPIQEFVLATTGFEYKGKGSNSIHFEGGAEAGSCNVSARDGDIHIQCSEEIGAETAVRYFLSLLFEGEISMDKSFQKAELNIDETRTFRASDANNFEPVSIYVATNGDDANGTGTIDSPLATIDAARKRVREYSCSTLAPITVYIRGGDYYLSESVEFNVNDSGADFAPITYTSYNGETVNILGSTKVDPSLIKKVTDQSILDRVIDKDAASKLMMIDFSSTYEKIPRFYSGEHIGQSSEYPFTIYCGDSSLGRSRYPNDVKNEGYLRTGPGVDRNSDGSKTVYYDDATSSHIDQYWSDATKKDLYIYGFLGQEWTSEAYDASEIDYDDMSITIRKYIDSGNFEAFTSRTRYYFFNLVEEIDVPGESYIDYEKRIVYFYPPEGFDANDVYVGSLSDSMFKMRDVSNVVIDGLNFMYTGKNAIDLRSSNDGESSLAKRNFTVKNCTIAHTSWNALTLFGTDITVSGCKLYDTANGGISINGGSRNNMISGNSVIENCEIHDINRSGRVYMPAIGAGSLGLIIRNNVIYNTIHEAVAINTNDVVLEYNEIYNAVTETSDMGAVYFGRDPSLMGIVIRHNYFHDIGNSYGGTGQQCIYVDDGNAGALIYGNIFKSAAGTNCNEPGAVKTHGSQFSQIYNNVFIDTTYAYDGASWGGGADNGQVLWYKWLYDRVPDKHHGIVSKVQYYGYLNPEYVEHYKGTVWEQMYKYINAELIEKYKNLSDSELNLIAREEAPRYTNKVYGNVLVNTQATHDVWGKNYEAKDNVTLDGSIFVEDGKDYTITEQGLAAIRETIPDFFEIPFEDIGIRK